VVSESDARAPLLKPLYTLGHSSLDFTQFAKLLKDFGVEVLADVRSLPQSSRYPHFSQPGFENLLTAEGISYLFLGEELGGRPDANKPRSGGTKVGHCPVSLVEYAGRACGLRESSGHCYRGNWGAGKRSGAGPARERSLHGGHVQERGGVGSI